jgi:branched-chain amino acid transport system permease protein
VDTIVQTLVNGLALGGTYALLAIGLAMVFSVMGLINFAHGELLTITGYTMVGVLATGAAFWMAAGVGVLAAVGAAMLMERIAFRPLRGAPLETLLLSSLAVSVVLQVGFSEFISSRSKAVATPDFFSSSVAIGGVTVGVLQLLAIVTTIALVCGLTLFLRRSSTGVSMRAAAVDFDMASLCGVRSNRMFVAAFALSGLLAGVAAILYVGQRGSVDPMLGLAPVLAAFLAVVVGGLGNLTGAALGGVLYGVGETVLEQVLPGGIQSYRPAMLVSCIVLVLILKPYGLLSRGAIGTGREV